MIDIVSNQRLYLLLLKIIRSKNKDLFACFLYNMMNRAAHLYQ